MDAPPSTAERSADGSNTQGLKKPRRKRQAPLLVDPLLRFARSTHPGFHALCHQSAASGHTCCPLAEKEELLKERIWVTANVSDACLRYISPSRAMNFLTNRRFLLHDLSRYHKACLKQLASLVDPTIYEPLRLRIQEFDLVVWQERHRIWKYQVILEVGILSYPAPARIGQAYLAALADIWVHPIDFADDQDFLKRIGRKYFSGLIRNMYTPAKDTPEYDAPAEEDELEMQWCPVTHAWHELTSTAVLRIMTWPFEEAGISNIFQWPNENAWKIFWGFGNGMVLLSSIKDHLDQDRIVIVPDEESADGRKLLVLDDSLLDQISYPHGPPFRDLHNSNLRFKTMARPHLDNLYIRCLSTLARRRRRRHNDPAENATIDLKRVPMHTLWKLSFEKQREWMIEGFGFEPADFE